MALCMKKEEIVTPAVVKQTLTSALKLSRKIYWKMVKNVKLVLRYSSQPSNVEPYFESKAAQAAKIEEIRADQLARLYQAVNIRADIDHTNATTWVWWNGELWRVAALIALRKTLKRDKQDKLTQTSMPNLDSDKIYGHGHLYQMVLDAQTINTQVAATLPDGITMVRYYDEEMKQKHLNEWVEMMDALDDLLYDINSMTELRSPPVPDKM